MNEFTYPAINPETTINNPTNNTPIFPMFLHLCPNRANRARGLTPAYGDMIGLLYLNIATTMEISIKTMTAMITPKKYAWIISHPVHANHTLSRNSNIYSPQILIVRTPSNSAFTSSM
jgi:hypothetical protein